MSRLVTLVAAVLAVAVVGGCAPGNEKATSKRQTVPVRQYDVNSAGTFDDDFELSKLRAVDPCATLRAADLSQYGKPTQDTPGELGSCSNFMKDHDGKTFSVSLYLDHSVYDVEKHRIGGLPTEINPDGSTCYVRSAYRGGGESMVPMPHGLQIQLDTEATDPCSPAVQIMSDVIEVLRTNPPIGNQDSTSLASFDPCAMLDSRVVRAATGGAPAESEPDSMYACDWTAGNGVTLRVRFASGTFLGGGRPVDLGGKRASVSPGSQPPSCGVEWEHRSVETVVADGELVQVEVANLGKTPLDLCRSAVDVARAVRTTLPAA